MKTTNIDAATAEAVAARTEGITERNAMLRRAYDAIADDLIADPTASATSEANPDVEAAYQRYNAKIRSTGERIHARHAEAIQCAWTDEARAVIESGRAFLVALEQFGALERDRGRFEAACGVARTQSHADADLARAIDVWVFKLGMAIAPAPTRTPQAPRVPIHQRIRELIAG
jgi:hypothetical protein